MAAVLEVLLKITLVIFMAGNLLDMGLRLQLKEALRDLRDARFVVLSVVWGFVALPAVAFAITEILPMAHAFAMGLVLLGMTPCAPFLPPVVERARGDMGYAAAFMLLASVVTVIYMPFAVPLLVKGLTANAWTIAKPLLLFLLVPLALGLALQHQSSALAGRLHPFVKKATGIDTVVMLVLCVVLYGKEFLELVGSHAIGAQFLFFGAATIGPYLLGFGLPRAQKTVMSLGMATRNLGAAFAPLFAIPGIDQRAIVMVAFGVLMQAAFSFGAAIMYGRKVPAAGVAPDGGTGAA
jgi:bile acid:Na+ symporter, BASS family